MHPDTLQLAAYLDGALSAEERVELRAHILTCAACAARLDRLREDARRIDTALAAGAAPDVRAAVRARLRRPALGRWLAGGMALAGALAALLLFALMIGAGSRGTAGRITERLFVTDRRGGRLVALDARSGARLGAAELGDSPTNIRYDGVRDLLYVMLKQSIVAIDPHTLQVTARWSTPRPFEGPAAMALDARRARLYVAQPGNITALALDRPAIEVAQTYEIGQAPSALALSRDGATLYALDEQQARLWTIDVANGAAKSQTLAPASGTRYGFLATSADGRFVYVLLTRAVQENQPALWRIDRSGASDEPLVLSDRPPPWDMDLLDNGLLAIPRGDGAKGGIELVDGGTLRTVARLDPDHDQHHATPGPGGTVFGLNFTHNTVTRFDSETGTVVWRTPEDASWQPWDGVYVPGGWRWPW